VATAATLIESYNEYVRYGDGAPKPALWGIYDVEEFRANGNEVPPTEPIRWRRAFFERSGLLQVRLANDERLYYRSEIDDSKHELRISRGESKEALRYEHTDPTHLTLDGALGQDRVVIRLKRFDETKYLLLSRGFHWINEFPFNR
jgi:hypothetical protein